MGVSGRICSYSAVHPLAKRHGILTVYSIFFRPPITASQRTSRSLVLVGAGLKACLNPFDKFDSVRAGSHVCVSQSFKPVDQSVIVVSLFSPSFVRDTKR